MARMEFLTENLYNTTTMVLASTGTGTFGFLFDRSLSLAYSTLGNTTNTSTQISIELPSNTVISNILIQNHNLRQFRAFYNSATANTFTPNINVTSNSATSSYYLFNSITVNSVQIQMDLATAADTERRIGELVIAERRLQFSVNPAANNYDPSSNLTRIRHVMPDGGISLFNISSKYKTTIKLDYITDAFRNSLLAIYNSARHMYYVPFPTQTTTWDAIAHEVVWSNDFDFTYADNSKTQGWSGKIILEETPSAS